MLPLLVYVMAVGLFAQTILNRDDERHCTAAFVVIVDLIIVVVIGGVGGGTVIVTVVDTVVRLGRNGEHLR